MVCSSEGMLDHVEVMKFDCETKVKGIVVLVVKGIVDFGSESKAVNNLPLFPFTELEEVYRHRRRAPHAPTKNFSTKQARLLMGQAVNVYRTPYWNDGDSWCGR